LNILIWFKQRSLKVLLLSLSKGALYFPNSLQLSQSQIIFMILLFLYIKLIKMENYLEDIRNRLKKKIKVEKIEIINNSQKHKSHKFFDKNKYHLHLKIKSLYLKSITRLSAQKLIMNVLKEDLKNKIHALEISID
jgi:stress-induced morphogen